MLLRVKDRPSQKAADALLTQHYLPSYRVTNLREYGGIVLDVASDDCRELMDSLEGLGFDCYADDEDEIPEEEG